MDTAIHGFGREKEWFGRPDVVLHFVMMSGESYVLANFGTKTMAGVGKMQTPAHVW